MSGINLGDAPSWIMVLVIGFAVLWAVSNGHLDTAYNVGSINLEIESLGGLMVIGAIFLGGFYFMKDIGNKL